MDFETEYRIWMADHISRRRGERLRRLKESHGYGEKLFLQEIWWPEVGSFDFLHPEYEAKDEEGNHYFMDFGYIRFPNPTNLEVDSFGSHARDIDRREFSRGLRRQNYISLSKWHIIRMSVDDIKENSAYGRSVIRKMMSEFYGQIPPEWVKLPLRQRGIVRMAAESSGSFTVGDVQARLGVSDRFARDQLHQLLVEGYLVSDKGSKRISRYRLSNRWRNNRAR